jgi:hypothetical protein
MDDDCQYFFLMVVVCFSWILLLLLKDILVDQAPRKRKPRSAQGIMDFVACDALDLPLVKFYFTKAREGVDRQWDSNFI